MSDGVYAAGSNGLLAARMEPIGDGRDERVHDRARTCKEGTPREGGGENINE